jgi:hypothetical protein
MKSNLKLIGEEPEYSYAVLPLDLVESFLRRFVAYPSEHALVAHILWIAHCHMLERFDTTPRLAFMSPEKMSGKTRALEVTALFVPSPILSISASPAVIVRLVAAAPRTILYDEIDAMFGTVKAQEANADFCSILNGGYRRGAKVYRCNTAGNKIEPEELDAFSPVALAGLRTLPDTLASRSIFIHMRRRAPGEEVEPFRERIHSQQAKPIMERLIEWCAERNCGPVEVELPDGIIDRNADCWEPLLVVADEAGGDWPERGRDAAVYLTANAADENLTEGVELLSHIKFVFAAETQLATQTLIDRLCNLEESPYADIRGKKMDGAALAKRLKSYHIKSRVIRVGDKTPRGYLASDFQDAWSRYLPPSSDSRNTRNTRNIIDNKNNIVAPVAPDAPSEGAREGSGTHPEPSDNDPFAQFLDPSRRLKRGE